jgi:hypothetical protein
MIWYRDEIHTTELEARELPYAMKDCLDLRGWCYTEGSVCVHDGEPSIRNTGLSPLSRFFRFQRNHIFREQVKRLPVRSRELTVLSGAV